MLRILFWIMLILILLLALFLVGANMYLQSNKTKILDHVAFINNGTVSFDEAHLSIFKDFPKASVILNNVSLTDSMYLLHDIETLQCDELTANISLQDWRKKRFEINGVSAKGGTLNIITNEQGYNNLKSLLLKEENTPSITQNKQGEKISVNTEEMSIQLSDFIFLVSDSIKTMTISTVINHMTGDFNIMDDNIKGKFDLDVNIDELTFKRQNGSYLKGAHIKGPVGFHYDKDQVTIDTSHLLVNEMDILFGGQIATSSSKSTMLNLECHKTILSEIKKLLPEKINKPLSPYQISDAFYTTTEIILEPNQPAKVDVDFILEGNEVTIRNNTFYDTKLKGRFVNRKYEDHHARTEERGNIKLLIEDISSYYGDFKINTPSIEINSHPSTKAVISTTANISGPAKELGTWYQSDTFYFEEGTFSLSANVQGPLNNIKNLLLSSTAEIELRDVMMRYDPADVHIPIRALELKKEKGNASFIVQSKTILQSLPYTLLGDVENIPALIFSLPKEFSKSDVKLEADRLGWEDVVSLFSKGKSNKTYQLKSEKASKKAMKQTLRGIYNKAHPRLDIEIDTFEYYDMIELYNLRAGAYFIDENTVVLDNSTFDLDQGSLALSCTLDISKPHQTQFSIKLNAENIDLSEVLPALDYLNISILSVQEELPDDLNFDINMKGVVDDIEGILPNTAKGEITFNSKHYDRIEGGVTFEPSTHNPDEMSSTLVLSGSPYLFNDFFQNDKFIFQKPGVFNARFHYTGDATTFDDLIERSDIELTIDDGGVLYKGVDVIFPLNDFKVDIQNDMANFSLFMYSDYIDRELKITGDLNHVSELLYGNTGKTISTNVSAYSPIINLRHAQDIFETPPDTTGKRVDHFVDNKLKNLVTSLLNRFNPDVSVELDTFVLTDKIILTDFNTGSVLRDSTTLLLEQSGFNFCEGEVSLRAEVRLDIYDTEPFHLELETENMNLSSFLESMDHFGSESIMNAKTLEGNVSFDIDFRGSLLDLQLIPSSTDARLKFKLDNLQVDGIDLIEKISRKLFVSRFFQDIQFGPIENEIFIKGSRIEIPQMEIQSTSIDFFVEGYIDEEDTNLWLSIPLDNLTNLRENKVVSQNREYAATKRKIYVELFSDEHGALKSKLRLRKKKFYEQRGIPEQYKLDNARDKQWRKENK